MEKVAWDFSCAKVKKGLFPENIALLIAYENNALILPEVVG